MGNGVDVVKKMWLILVLALCMEAVQAAENVTAQQKFMGLDSKVQSIKQDALDVGKEIAILEEQLLYPANTQFVIYLSADVDDSFKLVQALVKVDDRQIANYMYDVAEVDALQNGGIHQLHKGNLTLGKHRLTVSYMGKVGKKMNRYESRYDFEKGKDTATLELKVTGKKLMEPNMAPKEPQFSVKDWK